MRISFFFLSFSFFGGGAVGGGGGGAWGANKVYYGRCPNDENARMLSCYLSIDSKS